MRLAGFEARELDEIERLLGFFNRLRLGDLPGNQTEADIFQHGEVRKHGITLKNRVNRAAVSPHRRAVHPTDFDKSIIGQFQACDDSQQSRFATARWTQQCEKFTLLNKKIYIVESSNLSIALAYGVCL